MIYEHVKIKKDLSNASVLRSTSYGLIIHLPALERAISQRDILFSARARLARVFIGRPDLTEYLNNHPRKDDPEAFLITTNDHWRRPIHERTLGLMLATLGRKTLGKRVNPYQFRHGCFTEKYKFYTDRELKLLGGWTGTQMLEVYSHLNMKDVDDKTLQLHGLKKPKEKLSSLIEVKTYPNCHEDNAPFSLYCRKCNRTIEEGLSVDKLIRSKEDLIKLARALDEIGFQITSKK